MRLKQHLLLEGERTTYISEKDCYDLLRSNCQKAVKANKKYHSLYRGISGAISLQFAMVEPKKFTRKSKNTYNLYTLIIDNSPKWKAYPKRSQSIICSGAASGAKNYGKVFKVFPYDGSDYGICPSRDIWSAFTGKLGGHISLFDFNSLVIDHIGLDSLEIPKPKLDTYTELVEYGKEFDDAIKGREGEFTHNFMKDYKGNFIKWLQTLISPDSGFKHTKNPMDLPQRQSIECWTDGKSILIDDSIQIKDIAYVGNKDDEKQEMDDYLKWLGVK